MCDKSDIENADDNFERNVNEELNRQVEQVIKPILSGKLKNGSRTKESLHHITAQEDCCGWWYKFHLRSGVIFDSTDFSEWQVSA